MLSSKICCDGSFLALLLGQYLNVNLSYRLQSYAVEIEMLVSTKQAYGNSVFRQSVAEVRPNSGILYACWTKTSTVFDRKFAEFGIIDHWWCMTENKHKHHLAAFCNIQNFKKCGRFCQWIWRGRLMRYDYCCLLSTDMYSEASCPLIAIFERDLHGSISIKTVLKFSLEILKAERTVKEDCGSCAVLCNRQEWYCKAASCAWPQYPKPFSAVATVGYGL